MVVHRPLEHAAGVAIADFDGVRQERIVRHRALAAAALVLRLGAGRAELNGSAGCLLATTGARTVTIGCRKRHLLAEVAGHGYLPLVSASPHGLQFLFAQKAAM